MPESKHFVQFLSFLICEDDKCERQSWRCCKTLLLFCPRQIKLLLISSPLRHSGGIQDFQNAALLSNIFFSVFTQSIRYRYATGWKGSNIYFTWFIWSILNRAQLWQFNLGMTGSSDLDEFSLMCFTKTKREDWLFVRESSSSNMVRGSPMIT